MKKFILSAIAMIVIAGTAMANNTVNEKVTALFKAAFPGATNVNWKTTDDYTTVSFTVNSQNMQVFYDNDGAEFATTRAIQLNSLPMRALITLQNKYSDYTATEAIEFNHAQDGRCYYVSLNNDKQKLIVKISGQGEVSVFKKSNL